MDYEKYTTLLFFSIASTLALGTALFMYVIAHDYIFITFYNIISDLVSNGTMSSNWLTPFDVFIQQASSVVGLMDYIWLAVFIALVTELFVSSYKSEREGYPAIFGFLFYGTVIFLFISSIFETITGYIYNIFFNSILTNLSSQVLFFNFYIAHYSLINLIIVVICVILNFIDFNFMQYNNRKAGEISTNNGQAEL